MLTQSYYPWQSQQWRQILGYFAQGRFPHALVLSGPKDMGKLYFAQYLAQCLLCKNSQPSACGQCVDCQLLQAQTHPDLFHLAPQDSKIIKIEQVRELIEHLQQTAQQGGYQVVIIEPAETMHKSATNALLKTLEEPIGAIVFLLINHQSGLLPATISSRCQKINFTLPPIELSCAWLQEKIATLERSQALSLLAFAENIPLRALAFHQHEHLPKHTKITQSFIALQLKKISPLEMAALCLAMEFDLVINALWSVVMTLIRLKLALSPPVLSGAQQEELLRQVCTLTPFMRLFNFLDLLTQAKNSVETKLNLNAQLLFENLFVSCTS